MGKIKITVDVEEEALDKNMIRFFLQPLVENSVFHGLESKIEDLDMYIYDEDYHGDKAQIVEERARLADELSDILRELERGYDRDYRLERYPNNPRMWY